MRNIRSHDMAVGIGPAGTGKTYLAVASAVDALETEQVRRIVRTGVLTGFDFIHKRFLQKHVYTLRIQSLVIGHFKEQQQNVAAHLCGARPPGNPKAVAVAGDFDTQAAFDLTQMFIKLAAKICKAAVIGGLENYVPRNLDSIQCLYLKPRRREPPVRKTGAVPFLAKNLFRQ